MALPVVLVAPNPAVPKYPQPQNFTPATAAQLVSVGFDNYPVAAFADSDGYQCVKSNPVTKYDHKEVTPLLMTMLETFRRIYGSMIATDLGPRNTYYGVTVPSPGGNNVSPPVRYLFPRDSRIDPFIPDLLRAVGTYVQNPEPRAGALPFFLYLTRAIEPISFALSALFQKSATVAVQEPTNPFADPALQAAQRIALTCLAWCRLGDCPDLLEFVFHMRVLLGAQFYDVITNRAIAANPSLGILRAWDLPNAAVGFILTPDQYVATVGANYTLVQSAYYLLGGRAPTNPAVPMLGEQDDVADDDNPAPGVFD
jgi:hypothetical protein